MALTVVEWNFGVLEFAKTESIVIVQLRFHIMYHTELPTDKTIPVWYMKFQQSGRLCAAKPTHVNNSHELGIAYISVKYLTHST
jgi:hypothetical protein